MSDDTAVECPLDVAIAEVTAAAKRSDGRTTIHTYRHGGPVAVGADWDLDDAIACLRDSPTIQWGDHPIGHDLAALDAAGPVYFAVRRPEARRRR